MDRNIDLTSPKKPGEKVLSTLQLSRLVTFIVTNLRTIRRIGVGMLVLVIFLLAVFYGATTSQNNKLEKQNGRLEMTVANIVSTRTESRIQNCIKDKKFAEGHNKFVNDDADGDRAFLLTLATSGGRQEIRPQDQPIVDQEIAKIEKQRTENLVPVPDCSPQGIEDFYAAQETP